MTARRKYRADIGSWRSRAAGDPFPPRRQSVRARQSSYSCWPFRSVSVEDIASSLEIIIGQNDLGVCQRADHSWNVHRRLGIADGADEVCHLRGEWWRAQQAIDR